MQGLTAFCGICGRQASGPMLVVGEEVAHVRCIVRKLNELLDPDYNGRKEPAKILTLRRFSDTRKYKILESSYSVPSKGEGIQSTRLE